MAKAYPELSLSTCWLSHRHEDGYAMLKEVADLGFSYVELGHGTRVSLVPGIFKALAENLVRVSSTHNFCPLPPGVFVAAPNLFQPSSNDHRERAQWKRQTLRTVDFAHSLGVDRVVAHMGSMQFFWGNPSKSLKAARDGRTAELLAQDKDYVRQREALIKKLRKGAPKHLARVIEGLKEIHDVCYDKQVMIGAENREGLLELPLDEGFDAFLTEVNRELAMVGHWHDVGHAKLKEQMGFIDQQAFLEKHHARIIGWHLHDVTPDGKDHHEIGAKDGSVDWNMIRRFIRPDQVCVLELSPRLSREQVERSRDYVLKLFDREPIGPTVPTLTMEETADVSRNGHAASPVEGASQRQGAAGQGTISQR
ncbi:MAG: sugar phosphate isomerase/epimerase family protein [Opitutales bacterium]